MNSRNGSNRVRHAIRSTQRRLDVQPSDTHGSSNDSPLRRQRKGRAQPTASRRAEAPLGLKVHRQKHSASHQQRRHRCHQVCTDSWTLTSNRHWTSPHRSWHESERNSAQSDG